ncbi:MAG: VIT domain-containing protein [Sandaracinaceae bacterium]|nr:VIT domain-containing protein [Sandaracinaceae bacterium]
MRLDARSLLVALGLVVALPLSLASRAHAIGYLVPARADLEPLAIRYHRVRVSVRERVAETRVEQAFTNTTGEVLEATYVFPVPEGATVSGFALWINGVRQEGELLDSGRARAVYEQIVLRMQDPGLVEHLGGNLFRARVFPIQPRSEQRIEIRFTQTLDYQDGVVHYRYPLRTSGSSARALEDLTVTADVVSRTPIRAVYSPTHAIAVARPDEHHATVGFEEHGAALDRDFDLYYAVQDRDVGLSLLTHRPPGEDGYFLAMIAPRAAVTEQEIAAKEVLFVFDTSGSMAGDKLRRAQAALDYMLRRLNPSDRFQLVRFSTDVEPLFDRSASVPATPANVARARQFASRMVAAGGTAIHPALERALHTARPRDAAMPRLVVFLTDGMPTVGETAPARITEDVARWAGDARVYVFGVGDDVNTTFLDGLAQRTGGTGDYFRDGAELEARLAAFYDRIAYPLFTDLSLSFPGLSVYDVYPRDLGHLYRGGQLLVVGRYRGEGRSELALEGRVASERERRRFAYPVAFPAREDRNEFLPRIWATRKIGFLLDSIRMNGESPELRGEVVALAQRFGIVTPYTSYLVVEDQAAPPVLSEAPAQPAPVAPLPGTTFDFEDATVEGDLVRPDGEALLSRGRVAPRSGGARPAGPPPRARPSAAPPSPPAAAREPAPEPPPAPARAREDFAGFDGALAVPSTGGSGAASAPAPGATGERGRRLAHRLRSMREAERVDAAPSASRFVDGRAFQLVSGAWVDSRYRREMRTLRVRTASPAYFALLRARPALRRALALGARVTVAIDDRRAVVVEPSAPAELGEAEVQAFLAAP